MRRFVAEKDYARVIRRLPALMPAGGDILACLNAPHLGEEFLQALFEVAVKSYILSTHTVLTSSSPVVSEV